MKGLTPRQRELLAYIENRIETDLVCPSYDEMAAAFNIAKSHAYRLVDGLEERGYIKRARGHRARCLEVVRIEGLAKFAAADLADELRSRGYLISCKPEPVRRAA